jgi:hypothetical protein
MVLINEKLLNVVVLGIRVLNNSHFIINISWRNEAIGIKLCRCIGIENMGACYRYSSYFYYKRNPGFFHLHYKKVGLRRPVPAKKVVLNEDL